jgi:hypothetical protein
MLDPIRLAETISPKAAPYLPIERFTVVNLVMEISPLYLLGQLPNQQTSATKCFYRA